MKLNIFLFFTLISCFLYGQEKVKRIPFTKLNESLILPVEEILSGKVKFDKLDDFINKRIYPVKVEKRDISDDNSYKITYKCISDNFRSIDVHGRDWRNPSENHTFMIFIKSSNVKDIIVYALRSDIGNNYIEVDVESFRLGLGDECVFRNMGKNIFIQVCSLNGISFISFTNYDIRKNFSPSFSVLRTIYDIFSKGMTPLDAGDMFSKFEYLGNPYFQYNEKNKDKDDFVNHYYSKYLYVNIVGNRYVNGIILAIKEDDLYNELLKEVRNSYMYSNENDFYYNDAVICGAIPDKKCLVFVKNK